MSRYLKFKSFLLKVQRTRLLGPFFSAIWIKNTFQTFNKQLRIGYLNIRERLSIAGQLPAERLRPLLAGAVVWFKSFQLAIKNEWQRTWQQLKPDRLPAVWQSRALLGLLILITFFSGSSYFFSPPAVPMPAVPVPPVEPPSVSVRTDETNLLARTVAAEAEDEPYPGKVAVVAVVLNRLRDPAFPNTIADIIFEPWAFESVANGHFWQVQLGKQDYSAARDALNGWDPSNGALFFFNPDKATSAWIWTRPQINRIGDHIFTL